MVKAFRLKEFGGPEVLSFDNVELSAPGAGELRIKHSAIGVNFMDIYMREGAYPLPLPTGLGLEAAGVVEEVGPGVSAFAVGDRVAYGNGPLGAYAQAVNAPENLVVRLPDYVPDEIAAAVLLKGLTAQYLLRQTYKVQSGDAILVHAAAGGVGLLLCQWGKALGALVFGTVSTEEKAALARVHGCDVTINYTSEDFVQVVKEETGGEGVAVVYDSVGKTTFEKSLDCLAPLGTAVSFGNASGKPGPVDLAELAAKGSLFVTRPTLVNYTATRENLDKMSNELFDRISDGTLTVDINQRYELSDAAQAHLDIASRRTTGSTILLP